MDTTPPPVMTHQSGQFIAWQGHTWKQMKRSGDAYSDAHRLRRKNYMKIYRANKKARATEPETRADDVSTVTSVTTL